MRVEPSQLVPGCLLIKDVIGKTSRPIIPNNTALTEEHLFILDKFLVDSVDVSAKLSDGKAFKPKAVIKEEKKVKEKNFADSLFIDHYLDVVQNYKKLFISWRNNMPIDIQVIRTLLIPLFDRIDDIGFRIYNLHQYATTEDYIYHHSVSVALLSAYIAKRMGYAKGETLQIGLTGILSDSGMAKIDPTILKRSGKLRRAEQIEIKRHPGYSYRLVESLTAITQMVKLAVSQHHERLDGSGYPLGLSSDKIHSYARIVAVCDTYHAITCNRVYQNNQSIFKVIEVLQTEQFTKLDPEVVQTFVHGLTNLLVGARLKLSNDKIGKVIYVEDNNPTKPIIQLEDDQQIVSMENETTLSIVEVLQEE